MRCHILLDGPWLVIGLVFDCCVISHVTCVFTLPDKSFELPVMGTFEITAGKIKAWRDYFDTNQFTSRMG